MNTSIITKRSFAREHHKSNSGVYTGVLALIGGAVLIALSIMLNAAPLGMIGFPLFTIGFLYLNVLLWAWLFETGRMRPPTGNNWKDMYY